MKSRSELVRDLHALQGYRIRITFSPAQAGANAQLLFCAAAENGAQALRPENDAYTYSRLSSPFPEAPDPRICHGLTLDEAGRLWCDETCEFILRDPALHDSGLKLELEIPAALAEREAVMTVTCDEKTLWETPVTEGRMSAVLPLGDTDSNLTDYLAEAMRQNGILLEAFDRVCRQYDIPWYLICGGLIGVERDGILLPWDDDVDVAVTREGFDRLRNAVEKEWGDTGEFMLVGPWDYGKNVFLDYMTRFICRSERSEGDIYDRLSMDTRPEIHFHPVLDVHILDRASNHPRLHSLRAKALLLIYVLALGHRPSFNPQDHPAFGAPALRLVSFLNAVGRRIPLKILLYIYKKLAVSSRSQSGEYCYLSNAYFGVIPFRFRREWFGTPQRISCDGLELGIPADAKSYLSTMYGDYMKYPPVKNRRPLHKPEAKARKLS